MKRKKIILITSRMPSDLTETFLNPEIKELSKYFEIEVIPLKNNSCRHYLMWLKFPRKFLVVLLFLIKNSHGKKLVRNIFYTNRLIETYYRLRNKKIIHIHAYWASSPAFVAMFLATWLDVPYSFSCHRYDIEENDFIKLKAKKAKFIRSVSFWGKNRLEKIIETNDSQKIKVIHLGINIPAEPPNNKLIEKTSCVFPANFIKSKGHLQIIKFLSEAKNLDDISVDAFGNGPTKANAKKIVKKLKLSKVFKIAPRIPHNELLKKYKKGKYNLFILPSVVEAIPISMIEAMAHHIPIIVYNTGGISEILPQCYPGMIDKGNIREFAKILHSPAVLDSFRNSNYLTVKKEFDVSICTKSIIKAILK